MNERRSWQDARVGQEVVSTTTRDVTIRDEGGPLRLFVVREEASPGGGNLSPRMTLSEFYEAFYAPVVEVSRGNSPDTRSQNQTALRLWDRYTGNLPLVEIDQYTCATFVSGLLENAKIDSRTTVAKHAAAVQKVLRYAGPPSGRDWRACSLLERVPYIERPASEQIRCQEPFTLAELERLVTSTHLLNLPAKLSVSAATYWRALLMLLYNTGMRIQETIRLEWSDVAGHQLKIRSRARKGGRRGHTVELTDSARQALEWLSGIDPVRVFPWPARWASKSSLFKEFGRYRELLLPVHRRAIAFHGFRRLHNVELARINERACAAALGHGAAVNARSYVSRELVREAVNKLKQPRTSADRQLRLF